MSSSPAPPRTFGFRWTICGLLFFATTINYLDRQVLSILAPKLQGEFGWTEVDYGNIVFAFQLAYALAMIGAGRVIDIFGTRLGYPLQTSAKGMDPQKIKTKFGKDLCFWGGGVETQTTLPFGTVEQIRREVRDRIALLSEGGGFVFGTIHNIQPDIPPEKILAVFDTAQEA